MNIFKLSILTLVLGTSTSVWAKGGYIYEFAGDVTVSVAGGRAKAATNSMPLEDNTLITTGPKSRAVVKFEDGQVVVLRPDTTFKINKYEYNTAQVEKSQIFISLIKGGLRAITGLIGDRNKQAFRLSTPNATIGIRGTDILEQTDGPVLYGQVISGAIIITNAAGEELFRAGQSSLVASPSARPIPTTLPPLTFIQLLVIVAPANTPGAPPVPGTMPAPPSAQELAAIAQGISIPGATPSDLVSAMIYSGYNSATVTTAMIIFAPNSASSIVEAAVRADPDNAEAIVNAAVAASPGLSSAIEAAAIAAAPGREAAIRAAANAALIRSGYTPPSGTGTGTGTGSGTGTPVSPN
ncbi:MAG: FecR domain-containing protein [Gallionella sp.]|nr:FecR domain-containing protein [Gallionella sp.]